MKKLINWLVICGLISALGNTGAAFANGLPIHYELDEPARVSMGVYDGQGRLVRTILAGAELEAGAHEAAWDGLDRFGNTCQPGIYEWRALVYPGIKAEYLMSYGTNPDWPAWQIWVGDHMGPRAVAVDHENDWLYVVAGNGEGPPVIQQVSRDGTRRGWSKRLGDFWRTSTGGMPFWFERAAYAGGVLYVQDEAGRIFTVNTESGRHQRTAFIDALYPGDIRRVNHIDPGENLSLMHLAVNQDFVAVSYLERNAVRVFSRKDGSFIRELSIKRPAAITMIDDARLVVVGSGKVRELMLADGTQRLLFEDAALGDPAAISFDPANRHLLAAVNDQIRRYDLATGRLVQVYGREGGRAFGRYISSDFSNIFDLTADGEGGFFTAEELPRRVARFPRGAQEPSREWFGGVHWGSMITLDPQRPHVGYSLPDSLHFMRFEIDWEQRTWRPTHLFDVPPESRRVAPNGYLRNTWFRSGRWQIRRYAGKTWLTYMAGPASIIEIDDSGDLFRPASVLSRIWWSHYRDGRPEWWDQLAEAYEERTGERVTQQHTNAFTWLDRNGDGRLQPVEEVLPRRDSVGFGQADIDADWNLYYAAHHPREIDEDGRAVMWYRIPLRADAEGVPAWDWTDAEPVRAEVPEEIQDWARSQPPGIAIGPDGSIYQAWISSNPRERGQDRHGDGWPHNENGSARIFKWNPDGTFVWSVGKHAVYKANEQPGEMVQPREMLGIIDDRVFIHDRAGRVCVAWTTDGLVAGHVFDRHVDDGLPVDWLYYLQGHHIPVRYLYGDDHISANLIELHDGSVVWMTPAQDSTPIYRLHDIGAGSRMSGRLLLTARRPSATRQGTGLTGRYFKEPLLAGEPVLERLDSQIWFGMRLLQVYNINNTPFFPKDEWPVDPATFSTRWTGSVEARFAETYNFVVELPGRLTHNYGSRVRLWVGEELIIDKWDGLQPNPPGARTAHITSAPVEMVPGQRVPIRIEFDSNGFENAHLHLIWESPSQERQFVPATALYPDRQ